MPTSLRHLTLTAWSLVHQPDCSMLRACSNLEHLSLPPEMSHTDDVWRRAAATASQVHIVDSVGDADNVFQFPWQHPAPKGGAGEDCMKFRTSTGTWLQFVAQSDFQ